MSPHPPIGTYTNYNMSTTHVAPIPTQRNGVINVYFHTSGGYLSPRARTRANGDVIVDKVWPTIGGHLSHLLQNSKDTIQASLRGRPEKCFTSIKVGIKWAMHNSTPTLRSRTRYGVAKKDLLLADQVHTRYPTWEFIRTQPSN